MPRARPSRRASSRSTTSTSSTVAGPKAWSQRRTSSTWAASSSHSAKPPGSQDSSGVQRYWLLIHEPRPRADDLAFRRQQQQQPGGRGLDALPLGADAELELLAELGTSAESSAPVASPRRSTPSASRARRGRATRRGQRRPASRSIFEPSPLVRRDSIGGGDLGDRRELDRKDPHRARIASIRTSERSSYSSLAIPSIVADRMRAAAAR